MNVGLGQYNSRHSWRSTSSPSTQSLEELGCEWRISPNGAFVPINHTRR